MGSGWNQNEFMYTLQLCFFLLLCLCHVVIFLSERLIANFTFHSTSLFITWICIYHTYVSSFPILSQDWPSFSQSRRSLILLILLDNILSITLYLFYLPSLCDILIRQLNSFVLLSLSLIFITHLYFLVFLTFTSLYFSLLLPFISHFNSSELLAYTFHHLYGLNCTGLRFFTVYGPRGRPDMVRMYILSSCK